MDKKPSKRLKPFEGPVIRIKSIAFKIAPKVIIIFAMMKTWIGRFKYNLLYLHRVFYKSKIIALCIFIFPIIISRMFK